MAILQVWTGPRCQSGAVALGPLAQITSGRVTEATSGAQGPQLTIPRAVADQAQIRAGAWLWINHPRRGISEWPILTVTKGDGRALDTVTVQGGTIRQAIALRGTIRTINRFGSATTRFTLPALTPAEILRTYFFTNLAVDNLAWLTQGTNDFGGTITLGDIAQWSRGQLLDAIEKATGYRFVFTRLGDAAYQLDLRDPTTLGNATVLLAPGVTVDTIEQTEDLVSGATVVEPRGANGEALGETWWNVAAITGTGPFWVRLTDPTNGPEVIREDDQCNGWWLRPNDGLPVAIADSRAFDSSVQVASVDGLVVGGLAALWSTVDGALPNEVPSPAGVAVRGRVVQSVTSAVPQMRGNRITDPALRNALGAWQRVNPSAGGADIFRRDDPVKLVLAANGAVAGGATSVPVDSAVDANGNALIRLGDALLVSGTEVAGNANVTTSATGTASVSLGSTLPSTLADGTLLAWRRAGVDVGTVTTSGTNSAGASSLALRALTATSQLASGDVLQKTVAPGVTLSGVGGTFVNDSTVTIPNGAAIQFAGEWLVPTTITLPIVGVINTFRIDSVEGSGTTTASTAPGGSLTFSGGLPSVPAGAFVLSERAFIPLTIAPATWTLTGAPAAWDGSGESTPAITGTLGQTLGIGETLTWVRAGVVIGTVEVTATTGSGSSTIPLRNPTATRLLSGDTFSLPSQVLYASAQTILSATGTGTIPLRAATAGIADNAVITVQRCPDYAPAQFGGPLVLRLRGGATAAPTTYLGGSDFGLYSPIFRVQPPDPAQSYGIRLHFAFTTWAAEPGQAVSAHYVVWDVDTGARVQFGVLFSATATYSPSFGIATQVIPASLSIVSQTTTRRLRVSIHPGSNQSTNLGGFVFLRAVSATVYANADLSTFTTAALVDGSFSNQPWHRAQDLLDSTRDLSRYRVQLGTVAPFVDDPARLLTAGGLVRVRSGALEVDKPFRIARITWSLKDDDAIDLELATATPRLSEG